MRPGLEQLLGEVEALVERIQSEPPRCREFRLYRHTDAAGLLLPSGRAVLEFCAAPDLIDLRCGIAEVVAAHGTDGRTEVVFLD